MKERIDDHLDRYMSAKKVTDTIRVELSGINFGCRASTREPDFADQSLAASTVRTPAEVRCAVTWGNTGGNNDLAL